MIYTTNQQLTGLAILSSISMSNEHLGVRNREISEALRSYYNGKQENPKRVLNRIDQASRDVVFAIHQLHKQKRNEREFPAGKQG